MKPVTQTQEKRAPDRVLEALSTLAALLDRTIHEVKALDSDFESRLAQAVQEAESAAETRAAQELESSMAQTSKKLEEQFTKKIAELSGQWDDERKRLNDELSKLNHAAAQWEAERAHLNGELERLARVQAATQVEAEKALTAAKASAAKAANAGTVVDGDAITAEVQRVEKLINDISTVIEDPSTELSAVIRKNVERAELESYLRGIRFTMNGANRGKPRGA